MVDSQFAVHSSIAALCDRVVQGVKQRINKGNSTTKMQRKTAVKIAADPNDLANALASFYKTMLNAAEAAYGGTKNPATAITKIISRMITSMAGFKRA